MQKIDATPVLYINSKKSKLAYNQLQNHLPGVIIHYAVKACPHPSILRELNSLGSHFETASINEILECIAQSIDPKKIIFGHTIKKVSHILDAIEIGVDTMAIDSYEEVDKISSIKKGIKVYCRVRVSQVGASWPLGNRFGAPLNEASKIMLYAKEKGLNPCGLSFHVGSQQLSAESYLQAFNQISSIIKQLEEVGIEIKFINAGGGFPVSYREKAPALFDIAKVFNDFKKLYDKEIWIEPGRFLAATAGFIETEVIQVVRRENELPWVYLDIGRFQGLAEAEGEMILYKFEHSNQNKELMEARIAGPTCDGVDLICVNAPALVPSNIKAGDRLIIPNTGAYTYTYSSVGFNGFSPLNVKEI